MYYDQLVSDKERMKEITLDRKKQAQLLGILFADQEILTTEQASLIRQQMSRPLHQFADNNSLWAFYNYVTLALQQSHPKTWMEDQRVLHWFISEAFKFDKVENEEVNKGTETLLPSDSHSEEEAMDPAQVDLEDSIAEIEAERQEAWDEQTRLEEGFDHKGGLTNDELAADAEMQEMKTEQIIEEREEEDNAPIYDEDQIAERIREDEAAVAEVCDQVTDEEAAELIAGQEAVDKIDAEEAESTNVSDEDIDMTVKGPDFDMDFNLANVDDEDVESGDVDFDFA
jgi:hypothetical protein